MLNIFFKFDNKEKKLMHLRRYKKDIHNVFVGDWRDWIATSNGMLRR